VGAGKIGAGYADDPQRARHFSYGSHAQVLAVHPAIEWIGAVDLSQAALDGVAARWKVPILGRTAAEVAAVCEPEIAVIATPPGQRIEAIRQFPSLRAVLVEKPLGVTLEEDEAFVSECRSRGLLVQVNLMRRADDLMRQFAGGELHELIGRPQAAFGLYGNGLLNNGTHLIDLVRMLLGEIAAIEWTARVHGHRTGPLPGDLQAAFTVRLESGVRVIIQPLDFNHYREMELDIWGETGRIAITQEGFGIQVYRREACRLLQGEREVASDRPRLLESTLGVSYRRMYDNLVETLDGGDTLWSSGDSALRTARIVHKLFDRASGEPLDRTLELSAR
jgi:predicted dehydrogenase